MKETPVPGSEALANEGSLADVVIKPPQQAPKEKPLPDPQAEGGTRALAGSGGLEAKD